MSDQIVDSVQFDDTPDGGSTTVSFESDISTNMEAPDNPDTVSVVEGYDRRRGFQKEPSITVLDPTAHSSLAPLMKDRNDVTITITWKSGTTTVLSGLKTMVQPVTSTRPDFKTVHYDTDTSVTDNPTTDADGSWTELSEPLGGFSDNHEILTRDNARGLNYYIAGVCSFSIPMFYDSTALSNLRTEDNAENEIRVAVETSQGNYLIIGDQTGGGVEIEVHQEPSPEPGEVNHIVMDLYQTGALDDIITMPSGASNLFFGATVEGMSFAQTEGSIITENR